MADSDHPLAPEDDPAAGPLDSSIAEPPVFGESRHTVLSPSGEFESNSDFARGLGPRAVKIAIFGGGAIVMLFVLIAALQ